MGKTKKNKMQQKLQTILFFTFLICVQISSINTLKIKSKFKSQLSLKNVTNATTNTPVAPAAPPAPPAAPTAAPVHHKQHKDLTNQDLASNLKKIGQKKNTNIPMDHENQYHIHHVVPKNLTNVNDKVRAKIDMARKQLGELDDLQKETLEEKLFDQFPSKPAGIISAAMINIQKGEIAEQSLRFNLTSIKDLSAAISEGNIQKTRTVTVNGMTYKLKKVGMNFFYGAIVGQGGIGAYLKGDYVLVINHNNYIGFENFAYFFGQVLKGLDQKKPEAKFRFFKDNFEKKKDELTKRLTNDKALYNINRNE